MSIPSGTKFLAVPSTTDTTQRKSDQNNELAKVYTIEEIIAEAGGGSDYTETIVNISSAQILAMGSSPVELLPAPGVGKYYDWYMFLEYEFGTVAYSNNTQGNNIVIGDINAWEVSCVRGLLETDGNSQAKVMKGTPVEYGNVNIQVYSLAGTFNQPIMMSTQTSQEFTDGDGTLRVKIYHKTITFGA